MTEACANRWTAALNQLTSEDRQAIAFDGQDRLDVLNDLQKSTDSAKTKSIEKRWRCRRPGRGGETVILRDLFSKIVTWINHFKEIGDIVVQYDPTHAALPWAGVRFLLQVAVSDINKFDFVVEAAETIAHSISRFTIFESIYLHRHSVMTKSVQALEEALVRLYASTLVYLARAKQYFEQNTAKRVFKSVIKSHEEFEELLLNIDAEQTNVDRHASLVDAESNSNISDRLEALSIDEHEKHAELLKLLASIDGPICRMSKQLDGLEDRLNDTDRINILAWLSSQPYQEHHQQVVRKALRGSGQWLLHDPVYEQWHSKSVSSLLWLHGSAGSGKSTLISIVIEDAMTKFEAGQDPLPVYFYCSRNTAEPDRQDPDAVLASVSRQLSSVQPGKALLPPTIQKYKMQGEGFRSKGLYTEQSRELIVELIEVHGAATIIIDALDECDPDRRQSLLDAFEYILKESAGLVKIFVSSRDDQDIVWTLQDYPSLSVSKKKNSQDIEAFVRIETETLVRKRRLLRNSRAREEMQALIIDQVCQYADGMFRWASLQLEVLCQQKLDEDIRSNLGHTPPKLEQLYVEIYSQLTTYSGEAGRVVIEKTLKWLLCAQTTLNAPTFLRAVSVKNGGSSSCVTKEIVLDLCHNLVVYDEDLDTFRFAHLSVREFLENSAEFSGTSCNTVAAESCLLQMIATSDTSNQTSAPGDGHLSDLQKRIASSESTTPAEFLAYALEFWMTHCILASQNARSADTSFGRVFRSFISSDSTNNTAFDAWVQWFGRTLHHDAREWTLRLQNLLSRYRTCPLASFYVAVTFGFCEIVDACLQKDKISAEERRNALILAAVCAQNKVVDILMENDRDLEITALVLRFAAQYLDKERLAKMLGTCASIHLDQRIIVAGIKGTRDGRIGLLLEKNAEFKITTETLDYAMEWASLDDFRLLLNRTADDRIPSYVLSNAMHRPNLDTIALLLNKGESLSVTSALRTMVHRYQDCDDITRLNVLERLLAHGGSASISTDVMLLAVQNPNREILELLLAHGGSASISTEVMSRAVETSNREMLDLLLFHGGQITQDMLEDNASEISAEALNVLLEHGCKINGKTLKTAAQGSWRNPRGSFASLPVLLDRADETVITQEISSLLHGFAESGHQIIETMVRLLDRAGKDLVSQEMSSLLCHAAHSGTSGSTDMLRLLLDRAEDYHITEEVLMFAIHNFNSKSEYMQVLLERAQTAVVTECVVVEAVKYLELKVALKTLACFGDIDVRQDVLEAAAQNASCGPELVRTLLKKAEIITFPEEAFIEATENPNNGREVIQALEEAFGPIEMTEGKLLTLFRADAYPGNLLRWLKPEIISEKVLIAMLSGDFWGADFRAVAEKSGHLPITLEFLEAAAKACPLRYFKFFWARGRTASIPESLLEAAVRNISSGYLIVEFLLEEAEEILVGERLSVAVAERTFGSVKIFNLLLQEHVPVVITQHVLYAAVEAGSHSSIEWLLNREPNLEITDELFEIAASNGKEDVLHAFSKYCGLEDPPSKWLNVAKVFNAASDGDNNALKDLLDCGVKPDTSNPQGRTPLFAARWYPTAVTTLLSFGALPDPVVDGRTPLCDCVTAKDSIDLVKILVEAGASIDFREKRGKTPEEIAREHRNTASFMYLKRCRTAKENAGQASSPSA